MEIEFDCEQEPGNGKRKLNFHKGVLCIYCESSVNCVYNISTFRSLTFYFEDVLSNSDIAIAVGVFIFIASILYCWSTPRMAAK